ncbi:Bacteriophage Lambda NinG protein [compost metagenome]
MNLSARQPRPKKCRHCREAFVPAKSLQIACSPKCALEIVTRRRDRERKSIQQRERRELKARKEKLKSRRDYLREAQQQFNAYIRLRDRLAGHACISSGRPLDWSGNAVDAGHYRSVGAAPHLRFDERNCHAQSKHDNQFKSGNVADYRIGLIARIGLEAVEALEANNTVVRLTIEELKAIKAKYRALVRELKKGDVA